MTYQVLIVEDQEMPRQLFEIYIQSSESYGLAGTLTNASLAVDLCRAGGIDLVLMDVCTALGSNGLDAAEEIKREFPQIKVIIVTSMPEFSWLERARRIGVDSIWYKEAQKDGWEKQYQYKAGKKKEYMAPSVAEATKSRDGPTTGLL